MRFYLSKKQDFTRIGGILSGLMSLFLKEDENALVVCGIRSDYLSPSDEVFLVQEVVKERVDSAFITAFTFPYRKDQDTLYQYRTHYYNGRGFSLDSFLGPDGLSSYVSKRVFLLLDTDTLKSLGIPTVSYEGDTETYEPLFSDVRDFLIPLLTQYGYEVIFVEKGKKTKVHVPTLEVDEPVISEIPYPYAKAA